MLRLIIRQICLVVVLALLLMSAVSGEAFAETGFASWQNSMEWKCVQNTENGQLCSVTYGNGIFVAVGRNIVKTSKDGFKWTNQKINVLSDFKSVKWLKDRFFAVGFRGIMITSTDGVKWTAVDSGTNDNIIDIAYSGKEYVAVGAFGNILRSADGTKWKKITSVSRYFLASVVWAYGKFTTMDCFGKIFTSKDGMKWTSQSALPGMEDGKLELIGGKMFAGGNGGYATSKDAVEWDIGSNQGFIHDIRSAVKVSDTLIAVGKSGIMAAPLDGGDWTSVQHDPLNTFEDIALGNGTLVAVGHKTEGAGYKCIIWVGTNKYNNTGVKSTLFNVDDTQSMISNIPFNTTITNLIAGLEVESGATVQVFDNEKAVSAGIARKNMYILVTAADRVTTRKYKLVLNRNMEASVTSAVYAVNEAELSIAKVSNGTYVTDLIRNLRIPEGATWKISNTIKAKDCPEMVGLKSILEVTAENGVEIKKYTILVNPIHVIVNTVELVTEYSALVFNQATVMLPAETLCKKLGLGFRFDSKKNTMTASKGKTTVVFTVDSKIVQINGKKSSMDVPAKLINVPYIPIRYLCEKFGFQYVYDKDTGRILVKTAS